MKRFLYLLSLILLFIPSALLAGALTPQERLGKEIYLKTVSPSGREIKAYIGIASTEAPGSVFPCVNCHGRNGRGRPGSGIFPSNITYKELTKPYMVRQLDGRQRPAYTEETLARAITKGVDPAGNRLNPAMPLYSMSEEDLSALIAYLKHLGTELDEGVREDRIRVGTFYPKGGRFTEAGLSMTNVLKAYFDQINLQGGIYGRKLELQVVEYDEREKSPLDGIRQLVQEKGVFAIVGGILEGGGREISQFLEEEEVPFVGPFTQSPDDISLNRYTFYLFPGLKEEMLALLKFSKQKLNLPEGRIALLYPEDPFLKELEEAFSGEAKKMGWSSYQRLSYLSGRFDPKPFISEMIQKGVEAIFFMGSWEETKSLILSGDRMGWRPFYLLSGSKIGREIFDLPVRFEGKLYLGFPTIPSDQTETGIREFMALANKYPISRGHLPVQISAFASAKIFTEGVKLSGRELSRELLVSQLESINRFETGLTPRISYGPNRRIGSLGAYVVTVNLQRKNFEPAGGWISLE